MGLSLKKIRDERLFAVAGYKTFASYCLAKWGYTKSRTSRAISGALIGQSIKSKMPQLKLNEAQVRELIPLVESDIKCGPSYQAAIDVVAEVVKVQKNKKRLITARAIRAAVDIRLSRSTGKPTAAAITNTMALTLMRGVRGAIEALPKDGRLGGVSSRSPAHATKDKLLDDLDTVEEWLLDSFPSARVALAPILQTEKKALTVFSAVQDPYGEFGNMSKCPLMHDGAAYGSTEALFQCLRISGTDPVSTNIRNEIMKAPNGYMAKRKACNSVPDSGLVIALCDDADLKRMEKCLRLKLHAQPAVKALLLATGDSVIIEDCTNRPDDIEIDGKSYGRNGGPYWGAALVDDVWRGENKLGEIWMKLRNELHAADRS